VCVCVCVCVCPQPLVHQLQIIKKIVRIIKVFSEVR